MKLGDGKTFSRSTMHVAPSPNFLATQMLTGDMFAVANLLARTAGGYAIFWCI